STSTAKKASPAPAAEAPSSQEKDEETGIAAVDSTPASAVKSQPLSPAVRRLVSEEGIDASQITATGRSGRLTKGDVLNFLESNRERAAPAATADANAQFPTAALITTPRETRKRMSGLRQRIAQRLVEVQQTAAILTTFNEADMSRVLELRSIYKETFQK